jgi:hypothetical protein
MSGLPGPWGRCTCRMPQPFDSIGTRRQNRLSLKSAAILIVRRGGA